jgi:hypothetical protein
MTNVFAHMADLGEVMRGLGRLLAPNGVFITESHYLLDVLEKQQFDTVYHEHIRTYSLKSLVMLAGSTAWRCSTSSAASATAATSAPSSPAAACIRCSARVGELLALEVKKGLADPLTWHACGGNACLPSATPSWAGCAICGARGSASPARAARDAAATLVNFYGVRPDQVAYMAELHDSLKLGKYLPGAHLPVVHEKRLLDEQPDAVVLFAWHYGELIAERLRKRRPGARSW